MELSRSHALIVEGNPQGVSKGDALRRLAAHLNVAQAEVMAIGDQDNDASMIAWAGVGVAMGNGSPGVKDVADCLISNGNSIPIGSLKPIEIRFTDLRSGYRLVVYQFRHGWMRVREMCSLKIDIKKLRLFPVHFRCSFLKLFNYPGFAQPQAARVCAGINSVIQR